MMTLIYLTVMVVAVGYMLKEKIISRRAIAVPKMKKTKEQPNETKEQPDETSGRRRTDWIYEKGRWWHEQRWDWQEKVRKDLNVINELPEIYRNGDFFEEMIYCGFALGNVPDVYMTDYLCLMAVMESGGNIVFVPERFMNEELCHAAVQFSGYELEVVPEAFKTETVCIAAVKNDASALEYVPDALKARVKAAASEPDVD